jgi:hypothetical protein
VISPDREKSPGRHGLFLPSFRIRILAIFLLACAPLAFAENRGIASAPSGAAQIAAGKGKTGKGKLRAHWLRWRKHHRHNPAFRLTLAQWLKWKNGARKVPAVRTVAAALSPTSISPYVADASTLMLFHLDQVAGASTTANSGSLGLNAYSVDLTSASTTPPVATTVLGQSAFSSAFGKSATFSGGLMLGWDANGSGAYQGDVSSGSLSADRVPLSTLNIGNGGQSPFTIEALIRPSAIDANQEIASTDSSSGTRGFQFRLNSAGQLEFNAIATSGGQLLGTIPTSGAQAFEADAWYHVAVTYDGTTLRLYWTRLDAMNYAPHFLASKTVAIGTVQGAAQGPLVIGNENRGAAGEAFQGSIDEVRISNVARGLADFYWPFTDTDNDGLDDNWETSYFGNLAQTAAGDPDGDGDSNLAEFNAGTDPTVATDTDADGLGDAWEQTYFGTLSRDGTGDYDRDGFTDLAEYQGGSDPLNANSIPGDVDGDNLPDAWEQANLGGLSSGAYDDSDNDGSTNLAEMVAGTGPLDSSSHPTWKAPRVGFLRDSVAATDACLMPSSAPYGRAINGVSFQKQILLTFDGYQYTAWYDTNGSTQTVWLARRTVSGVSVGAWEKVNTGSTFVNGKSGWDAHNVISLGISPKDGTLHMSWDHHNNTLRYRRSVVGLCTTNKAAWGAGMMNAEQNWLVASGSTVSDVTYPLFINSPTGDLVFQYRTGITNNGDQQMRYYNPATGAWGANWRFSAKEGSYTGLLYTGYGTSTARNAYPNGFDFAPDGSIHVTWTYREQADSANHDLHYAYSLDGGVTWRNNAGTQIADTSNGGVIRVDSPGIVFKTLDSRQLLINQQAQCVDNDGRVHVLALHRRAEPGYEYPSASNGRFSTLGTAYYHYFRDPETGVWAQRQIPPSAYPVGSRPEMGYDAKGNVYAIYVSYSGGADVVPGYSAGKLVIASASKASSYTDWEVVQVVDTKFNGEPLIDRARLLSDNILSVYIQEDSATTSLVGTPLHVLDFAVDVPMPSPTSFELSGNDAILSIDATATSTYQLQSTTDLVNGPWQNVGTPVTGKTGLLSLADPNPTLQPARFYRILITN